MELKHGRIIYQYEKKNRKLFKIQRKKEYSNLDKIFELYLHGDIKKLLSKYSKVEIYPTINKLDKTIQLNYSYNNIYVIIDFFEDKYNVVAKYSYDEYPGNPNGSDYSIAALASADGRHLAIMPHLERSIFPWQNGCYPADRKNSDQVTPWIEAFVNARKWVEAKMK